METRKERYRRYREEIKQMRDDAFPNAQNFCNFADVIESQPSLGFRQPMASEGKEAPAFTKKRVSPYRAYQKRRWIGIGIKTLALLVTIALFLIWYFSIAARS